MRIASSVAVFTGGVPVGGTGSGEEGGVAVGGDRGDETDRVDLAGKEASGERDGNSPLRATRHTRNTTNSPAVSIDVTSNRVRRLT